VAEATTIEADFNDMTAGTMYGQSGGTGFDTNVWSVNTSIVKVQAGDLTAPAGTGYAITQGGTAQSVIGEHASADRRQARKTEVLSGEGQDIWFSFLVLNSESTHVTGIDFRNHTTATTPDFISPMILVNGTGLDIYGYNGLVASVSNKVTLGETALIVGKLVLNGTAEAETLSLWVNPTLTSRAALEATAADLSSADLEWDTSALRVLGLNSFGSDATGNGGVIDSVRLSNEGDAFEFATGVPAVPGSGIVADFNDLSPGTLYNREGGTGFEAPWSVNTSVPRIETGDLAAPESTGYNIPQVGAYNGYMIGRHASADRRQARDITDLIGSDDIWFSFLVKNDESTDATGIDFRANATAYTVDVGPQQVFLIGQTLFIGSADGLGGSVDVSSKTTLGEAALIVGKVNTAGDSELAESLDVWVNPDVTNLGPADFSTSDVGWNLARLSVLGINSYDTGDSGTGGFLDAIRISKDTEHAFEFVTGVVAGTVPADPPEPAILFIESGTDSVIVSTTNLSATAVNTLQVKGALGDTTWSNLYSATGVTATNWTVLTTNQSFFQIQTAY
jgi:hypothetical protein